MKRPPLAIAISIAFMLIFASLGTGADIDLSSEPELQQLVSGHFLNPTAKELIDSLRKQSGLELTLDSSVIQDRPIRGHIVFPKIPLWGAMQELAINQWIKGYWRKIGSEYRLVATYSGPPPAEAKPLSKEEIASYKASTEPQFGPLEGAAANPPPPPKIKRDFWRWGLSAGGIVALVAIALIWSYRRRRAENAQAPTAKAPDAMSSAGGK